MEQNEEEQEKEEERRKSRRRRSRRRRRRVRRMKRSKRSKRNKRSKNTNDNEGTDCQRFTHKDTYTERQVWRTSDQMPLAISLSKAMTTKHSEVACTSRWPKQFAPENFGSPPGF